MGVWSKSRQSGGATDPTFEVEKTDTTPELVVLEPTPANFVVHPVSPPTYWPIDHHAWLPEAVRGLEMVYPAEDWGLNLTSVEAAQAAAQEVRRRQQRGDPLCPACGSPLFWSPLGDLDGNLCVQCHPRTSPRLVEDLWLAELDGWQACVSNSETWKRAAFSHLAGQLRKQQERDAARAAIENQGF